MQVLREQRMWLTQTPLVGDDGVVDSVATWAWMLFSLWWRAFCFSLGNHFKFGRENCIIIRQVDVVGLDAWR